MREEKGIASPRKHYSAEIKAKVALEAIKGMKTTNEIAAEYGVHPTQIAQWKKQALDELPQIFASKRGEPGNNERICPYLLRNLTIDRPNYVRKTKTGV